MTYRNTVSYRNLKSNLQYAQANELRAVLCQTGNLDCPPYSWEEVEKLKDIEDNILAQLFPV